MTTTPATTEIDTLKALEQAATPAPWKADVAARGDCVLWGPNGQFVANAQSEPHWLPAADGGKRAVMFDVDRRDVALIEAMRNALPALLDELAKTRAELEQFRTNAELLSCSTMGEAFDRMEQTRAELAEFKALSHDYNWQWQLESGVSRIFEGRAAWLYRNSTRMTQMRYDAATAAGYDFTQYSAQMDQPVDRDALIAYLREEITLAEQEIAAIEANPATTAEPADEPKADEEPGQEAGR